MLKSILSQIRSWPPIFWIVVFGLVLRILFVLVGAAIYYGRSDFWLMGGDTYAWFDSFLNLYKHGIYTLDPSVENGKFFRPPGYSFIMGAVYLFCGQQTPLMETTLIWLQTVADVITIYLIYKISWQSFGNKYVSNIASILYAGYPFIIVWVPVLYAESLSIFFLMLCLYFFTKEFTVLSCFLSAFCLGFASLLRLQCLPVFGILAIIILLTSQTTKKNHLKYLFAFLLAFIISYGLWPLRNYFIHQRLVFTQDLRVGGNWSQDYLSFFEYLKAIQVDIQPQKDQIVGMNKATWPPAAIIDQSDAYLLDSLSSLCRNCGTGFSFFRLHAGKSNFTISQNDNCDSLIESGFKYLTTKQKERNKWHYYIKVPLGNLKKALFKSSLYGNKSDTVTLTSSILFGLRTILIFLGLAGIIIGWIKNLQSRKLLLAIFLYSSFWYLYMSFIFRQMEMRYLLHADVLLLFPTAYFIYSFFQFAYSKSGNVQKS